MLLRRSISTMDGTVFEQYVGYRMLEDGYRDILFTAATGDFGADIIAYDSDNRKVCVQCVSGIQPLWVSKPFNKSHRQECIMNVQEP